MMVVVNKAGDNGGENGKVHVPRLDLYNVKVSTVHHGVIYPTMVIT